jgi:hypothetical protein
MGRRAATLSLLELITTSTSAEEDIRTVVARKLRGADAGELIPMLLDVLDESPKPRIKGSAVRLLGRVLDPHEEGIEDVHEALLDVLGEADLGELAGESLRQLESERLEKRLRVFTQRNEGSPEAIERAEAVLEDIESERVSEVVRNDLEYTYVRDPADYTRKKRSE